MKNKTVEYDYSQYKYIYPPNAKKQTQLDIMMDRELHGLDPLAPDIIEQEILFETDYWYVSRNRFPYEGVEYQFLIAALGPVYKVEDISEEMWIDLNRIWLRLISDFGLSGGALCFRFGEPSLSGASLKRLHAHLIMPKEGEKSRFTIGGNKTLKEELHL